MPTAQFQKEGVSITVDQATATVEVSSVPDPNWEYVDEEGHRHSYDEDMNLPTLERRLVETRWSCLIQDTLEIHKYFCKECGEQVTPGRHNPPPTTIPLQVEVSGEVWKDSSPHFERVAQTFGGDPTDLEVGPYIVKGVRARTVTLHHCEFVADSIEIDMEELENDESIRTRP